ncbi:MAG: GxxExxY protein [Sedimentisphaerales bacterium]|nr:GxxExxY protein [Sedimentisphaerales bacterium]
MYKHQDLTQQIIKAAQNVHNTLGYGFLEKVYHNAMVLELRKMGLDVAPEKPISVYYDGQVVGEYFADIVVADKVILEIKAVQTTSPAHEAQLVNYLKATKIDVGLLLNFGESLEVKRKIFETARQR